MHVLVVGDTLIDYLCPVSDDGVSRFVGGKVPPPTRMIIGGAARTAFALTALGHKVALTTTIGSSNAARSALDQISVHNITCYPLRSELDQPTRVWQLVRDDGLSRGSLHDSYVHTPSPGPQPSIRHFDLLVINDYAQGTVRATPTIIADATNSDIPIVWDPHPIGVEPPRNAIVLPSESETTWWDDAGGALLDCALRYVANGKRYSGLIVTVGPLGSVCFDSAGNLSYVPTGRMIQAQIHGAGDIFCACVADAYAPTASVTEIASKASSSFGSLWDQQGPVFQTIDDPARWRMPTGLTDGTIATSGCFDILHAGHLKTLSDSRALGSKLVVMLNSDRSVHLLKGNLRPIASQEVRKATLLALPFVDDVVVFDDATPGPAMRPLCPQIFTKGGDYVSTQLAETPYLREWGGLAMTLPFVSGLSTTAILSAAKHRLFSRQEPT